MERLLEIDGAIEFFLMTTSMNVDSEGSSTNIVGDRLIIVVANVNRQFGTDFNCFDIKLTWDKLRSLWETWVRATHYVPPKKVNSSTGEINIDDFAWDQLVRVSLVFFSVKASLSVSFLDLFVAYFIFLFIFFFFFFLLPCFLLCINVHALLKTNIKLKLTYESKSHDRKE